MTNTRSEYEVQYQPPETRGNSFGWATEPIRNPVSASWDLAISHTDAKKLVDGFVPKAMEDKWLCYSDTPDAQGNTIVHMCRSWSKMEQMALKLRSAIDVPGAGQGAAAKITEITWEAQDGASDLGREEAKEDAIEICNAILGCELKP